MTTCEDSMPARCTTCDEDVQIFVPNATDEFGHYDIDGNEREHFYLHDPCVFCQLEGEE